MSVQLKGNLKAAADGVTPLVDVSANVTEYRITTNREAVNKPATLATGVASTDAGARSDTLTITFFSDHAAASFWAMLYDVISTDSSVMKFEGTFNDGAVSASNPKFGGKAVLLSLESGTPVGQLRQQTISLPIVAGSLTETTTP